MTAYDVVHIFLRFLLSRSITTCFFECLYFLRMISALLLASFTNIPLQNHEIVRFKTNHFPPKLFFVEAVAAYMMIAIAVWTAGHYFLSLTFTRQPNKDAAIITGMMFSKTEPPISLVENGCDIVCIFPLYPPIGLSQISHQPGINQRSTSFYIFFLCQFNSKAILHSPQ